MPKNKLSKTAASGREKPASDTRTPKRYETACGKHLKIGVTCPCAECKAALRKSG